MRRYSGPLGDRPRPKDFDFGQQGRGGSLPELEAEEAGKAQVGCEGDDAGVVGKGAGENLVERVVPPSIRSMRSRPQRSAIRRGTFVRLTS